jgi:hypothetical protein
MERRGQLRRDHLEHGVGHEDRGEDGRYKKAAYKKGQSLEGQPANSSDAEKIK